MVSRMRRKGVQNERDPGGLFNRSFVNIVSWEIDLIVNKRLNVHKGLIYRDIFI